MPRPLLLGHRGARLAAPENTLSAFDLALAHGCDGFEFDVRRTADRRGVVCHDANFRRRTIARSSYAELSAARFLDCQAAPPCCLEDVLERFSSSAYLDIELKDPGLEEVVVASLRQYRPQRGYVVSSFREDVLREMRRLNPDVPLAALCDKRGNLDWCCSPLLQAAVVHYRLISPELIQRLHDRGTQVFAWTVNDRGWMLRLAEWGVDAIISDDTERLSRVFAEGSPLPNRSCTLRRP